MRAGAEPVVEGGGVVVGGGGGGGFTPPFARAAPEKLKANSNSPNFFVVFIMNNPFVIVVMLIDRPTCRVNYSSIFLR